MAAQRSTNKGPRRQILMRLPMEIADKVIELAEANDLPMSEVAADLVATSLGFPKPSETLPQRKSRRHPQREELALGMTA